MSLVYELPFADGWDKLIRLASRWVWEVDFAAQAAASSAASWSGPLLRWSSPINEWLSEDYFIFHVREMAGAPSAADLIQQHGAQNRAGGSRRYRMGLSESECNEVLQSQISYYAQDLTVIGWNAAFLYDSSRAPRPPSSCSNTPTPSCWSFATTTTC